MKNPLGTITGTTTYTYDTYGNIREKKIYAGTATSANLDKTYTYTYPTSGWLDKLGSVKIDSGTAKSLTYDAIGNPLTYYNGKDWTFTWKNGRQLATAVATGKNLAYTYDVDGIRDSKTVGGVTHYYETLNGEVVRETWTQSGTTHTLDILRDDEGRPYAMVYDGTVYYYVLNQQGDVIQLIDSTGATVANYTYNAWGELVSVTNGSGSNITSSTHVATINPIRYRGYYYDTETGFYYLQSRYYDPTLGRFINADSQLNTDSYLGYNMYAYCGNNPVNHTDPDGHGLLKSLKKAAKKVVKAAKKVGKLLKKVAKALGKPTVVLGRAVYAYTTTPSQKGVAALKSLHYSRNIFNNTSYKMADIEEYEVDVEDAKFHQNNLINGKPNRKFVVGDWFSSEIVYYSDGTVNNTPEDMGTFNVYYGSSEVGNIIIHGIFDVIPYMFWGNTPDDPTTQIDRIMMIFE